MELDQIEGREKGIKYNNYLVNCSLDQVPSGVVVRIAVGRVKG